MKIRLYTFLILLPILIIQILLMLYCEANASQWAMQNYRTDRIDTDIETAIDNSTSGDTFLFGNLDDTGIFARTINDRPIWEYLGGQYESRSDSYSLLEGRKALIQINYDMPEKLIKAIEKIHYKKVDGKYRNNGKTVYGERK